MLSIFILLVSLVAYVANAPTPLTEEQVAQAEVVAESIAPAQSSSEPAPVVISEENVGIDESGKEMSNTPSHPTPKPKSSVSQTTATTPSTNCSPYDSNSPCYVKHTFSYVGDFEDAYLGYCAKDVPAGEWGEDLRPSVALGIKNVMPSEQAGTMKGKVISLFNTYVWEGGRMSRGLGDPYNFTVNGTGKLIYFTLHWSTRTISYHQGNYVISADEKASLEAMAAEATAYLRWMDSAYIAKCGQYKSLY